MNRTDANSAHAGPARLSSRPSLAAVSACTVALAFAGFFETTKHVPRVADIAPFVEDPYDAVCSFGVQLAAFAAALAVLRAFGPAAHEHAGRARPELVARAR